MPVLYCWVRAQRVKVPLPSTTKRVFPQRKPFFRNATDVIYVCLVYNTTSY